MRHPRLRRHAVALPWTTRPAGGARLPASWGSAWTGCPGHANPAQEDLDGDRRGDACDPDRDGDGHSNSREEARGSDPDDAASVP